MAGDALLNEVRQSAEAALEAQATGENLAETAAGKLTAARAALDAGVSISAIAAAEAAGERAARERVGGQILRLVERSAKKMRDATEEHERSIVQAAHLGLPSRDIAAKAGVSHGTVAAVARRHEQTVAAPPEAPLRESSQVGNAGEPAPKSGAG